MNVDWSTILLGVLTLTGTASTAWFATRKASEETRANSAVALAATQATAATALASTVQHAEEVKQKAGDAFQERILAKLEKTEAKLDALAEKHNALALEYAELNGKVAVLENTRDLLTVENTHLRTENKELKRRVDVLDDENALQGQRIAELTGRLTVALVAPATTTTTVSVTEPLSVEKK